MAVIGYCRVSTAGQELGAQISALKDAGADKIYDDVGTGSKMSRPGLEAMLGYVREGDVVLVTRLDRLSRSLSDLLHIVTRLKDRGAHLMSAAEQIDTTTPSGTLLFHVVGAMAELELNLIRERTRTGLAEAARQGRRGGRPRKATPEAAKKARALLKSGLSMDDAARRLKMSRRTLFTALDLSEINVSADRTDIEERV